MKKYLKLTTNDAIRHFILKDSTLAPETSGEIWEKLNDLDKYKSEICVSIVIPTHRIHPDSQKDSILLKNCITEAENTLYSLLEKRQVWPIVENIKEAQEAIDFRLNLDSLALYANEHFSSVIKLPVDLEKQITIGNEFDLRPLYKTRQQNRKYYILTISKQKIRLIEALNDKAVNEIDTDDFPFDNSNYITKDATKIMQDTFVENLEKEYFNDADKRFQKYYIDNPLPVVLAGDVKSVAYYEEQMDEICMVLARVQGNFDNAPLHEIIDAVQPEIEKYRKEKQDEYLSQIDRAQSAHLVSTDINDIYRSVSTGGADTLYVENNFSLNGKIVEDQVEITDQDDQDIKSHDLLNVFMKNVTDNGGQVVFMEDGLLEKYNGIVLVRRF